MVGLGIVDGGALYDEESEPKTLESIWEKQRTFQPASVVRVPYLVQLKAFSEKQELFRTPHPLLDGHK